MLDELNEIYLMIKGKYTHDYFSVDHAILFLNKKPQRKNEFTYFISCAYHTSIIVISERMYNMLYDYKEDISEEFRIIVYTGTIRNLMVEDRQKKLSKWSQSLRETSSFKRIRYEG